MWREGVPNEDPGAMYIYSPDALIYDSTSNSWALRPDYDPQLHRVWISFSDDDPYLDGDMLDDEIGSDPDQTATVTAHDGTPIISGQVYDEEYYEIQLPGGAFHYIDRIEIGGQLVGYVTTTVLEAGISYPQTATSDVGTILLFDDCLTYAELSNIPCFAAGTCVMTTDGMVPVDWLRAGDRVLTRDRGFQPLLWVGRFEPATALAKGVPSSFSHAPIVIAPDALGPGLPSATLRVSPQHRILIQDAGLQLCFGHEAMFCAAGFLTGWPGISQDWSGDPVVYCHLLLPQHEAVLADGVWTESLFLGDMMQDILPPERVVALKRHGNLAHGGHAQTAYPCLRRWEAALLRPPGADEAALPERAARAHA